MSAVIERGRFAPTPSGALHLGSARTAMASAFAVWSRGGRWVLRLEDLDVARTPPGAVRALLDDLRWLGLDWDEGPEVGGPGAPYAQSARAGLYRDALISLQDKGLVYPCACSRRDVEQAAQAPHGREPVYPGTCRDQDPARVLDGARVRRRGVSWRFRVPPGAVVTFDDLVQGPATHDVGAETGDFVVFRADGVAAYQLAVVVDDIAMGITEVVRGDDLLDSTPRQVLLYRALGGQVPRWAHLPLVLDAVGDRLAKRSGAMGLGALRAAGITPEVLRRWLLRSLAVDPGVSSLRAAAAGFTLSAVPREPLRWTPGALTG